MAAIFGDVRLDLGQLRDLVAARIAYLITGVQCAVAMATRVRVQIDERIEPLGGDQRSRVAWMTRLTTRPATTLVDATARPLLSGEAV
jgi:hypothetical protein